MRRRGLALVPIVTALFLTGCATQTSQKEILPDIWWVCDGNKDSADCGPNPEKGLNKTCFTEGKTIQHYWRLAGGGLIVQCK